MVADLLLSATGNLTVDGGTEGTTETSVFSGTVPGGTLGTNGRLVIRTIGDIRNDSGAGQDVTLRWKYGGTTFHTWDFPGSTLADAGATDRYACLHAVILGAENSASAQRSMMEHRYSGAIAEGNYAGGNDHNTSVNSIAVSSGSDQTLELTAQLSAANSELEYRRRGVWVERWDTSDPSSGTAGTRLVDIDTTETTVVNTTTETSVYSATIPGGTLGTANLLVLRLDMDAFNNSGSSAQWWTDVYWGGVHIFDGVSGVAATSGTTRRAFPIDVWIGGGGSTSSQICAMFGQGVGGLASSGDGVVSAGGSNANNSVSSASVDSTSDQTLEVKVQMNVANANTEVRRMVGSVAVIKA